jgi:hypothetical protein
MGYMKNEIRKKENGLSTTTLYPYFVFLFSFFYYLNYFSEDTDNDFRPFRRLCNKVLLPPAVLVRERNPCVFALFRFFGLYVNDI